jgi:SAM-dependent methyltransferase
MPMTQANIREHYEDAWRTKSDAASGVDEITYSSPIEDAIVYPLYRQMIADLHLRVNGGDVLDVGSGSGRWIRFFLDSFQPRTLTGTDYTAASVELLRKWFHPGPPQSRAGVELNFRQLDITKPDLDLGRRFDLINIANVLFHIPEQDLFANALRNLVRHVAPHGMVVTTEYLPRTTMRTEWMLVRDRYTFERMARDAGLRIAAVKAFGVFANDPMGIDGPDTGPRGSFMKVRAMINHLGASVAANEQSGRFVVQFLTEVERSLLDFCRERVPDIDMPSQKLVFLAPL